MKRLFAVLPAFMMAAAIAMPSRAEAFVPEPAAVQDTLILKLRNQAKVLVVVKDIKDIKSLKSQSLDSLIVLLEKHVDQIERAGKTAAENPVTITIDKGEGVGREDVNITITQANGDKKKVISKEIKNIRVDVDVEKEENKTTIGVNMQKDTLSTDEGEEEEEKEKERYKRKYSEFQLDYGADRWANAGGTPGVFGLKPSFRPVASRYISLATKWHRRLGGPGSPARISSGLGFEFHNYMFDDNQHLVNTGEVSYMATHDRELEKSKLATTSFTIPLELSFDVKNSEHNTVFRIGGGGFVGYLLGSKTKTVFNENGDDRTVKVHNDYNLNDLQYGVSGFIGMRGIDIFAKYNLNDMFKDNRGPKGNALAFGLRWNM